MKNKFYLLLNWLVLPSILVLLQLTANVWAGVSVSEEWAARFDGSRDSRETAKIMTTDAAGNVYVAGESRAEFSSADFLVVKYDKNGSFLWAAKYNGPNDIEDYSKVIAVDDSGNVYVAGDSYTQNNNYDKILIKYNADGEQQWIATFDSGGGDTVAAIGVYTDSTDGKTYAYVAGWSQLNLGQSSTTDYTTIKYDAETGNELWVRHYNGPGNSTDTASALAIDTSGNVFVTGRSRGASLSYDYATIKYQADGTPAWDFGDDEIAARYNSDNNKDDYANAIGVDSLGNVLVTGYTEVSFSDKDFVTIKYNSDGAEQWVNVYDGPPGNERDEAYALAIDSENNVYVTGNSYGLGDNRNDFATIKYTAAGAAAWDFGNGEIAARYHHTDGSGGDFNRVISLDSANNVYVSGQSYGADSNYDFATVKYSSSNGSLQWVQRYDSGDNGHESPIGIAIYHDGGQDYVYVAGLSERGGIQNAYDFVTAKYAAADGTLQWLERYNELGSSDSFAVDLDVDKNGNVYVTGYSEIANSNNDYVTAKYSPSGEELWVRTFGETPEANTQDEATAIVVDDDGNVYVTGKADGADNGDDFLTIKYDANGNQGWVKRYDGGVGTDIPVDIELFVDSENGNTVYVYVTGHSYNDNFRNDFATVKYAASDGNEEWVRRYFYFSADKNDKPSAMAVDSSGNVYVTGTSQGSGGYDIYSVMKYDKNGVELWDTVGYSGPAHIRDIANAIAIDGAGNVYVTGQSDNGNDNTGYDFATVKFNAAGEEQWVARYNGTGKRSSEMDSRDYARAIAVDNLGNVYVTGESEGLTTGYDYVTVKYNLSGAEQWVARYDGGNNLPDFATAMALDSMGNVYVTGRRGVDGEVSSDYATIRYDNDGNQIWLQRYSGGEVEFATNIPATIKVVDDQHIYVTGESKGIGTGRDFGTVKYLQVSTGIDVTPLSLGFGDVVVGESSSAQEVTVTNTGTLPLAVTNMLVADELVFGLNLNGGASPCLSTAFALEADSSCTVEITFSPVTVETINDILTITSNEPEVTIPLSGNGVGLPAPNIVISDSVSPTGDRQLPFGNVVEMATEQQTVTISNDGSANLVLGNIAQSNSLAAPFSIANDNCSAQTLLPSANCQLNVIFSPTSIADYSDSFDIPSSDADEVSVIINVSGTGINSGGGMGGIPSVASVTPTGNSVTVSIGLITATFSEDVSGISDTSFIVSDSNGPIAGTVSYDAVGLTASFQPTADTLEYNTTYTARIVASQIQDLDSNNMATDYIWSFTTADEPPVLGCEVEIGLTEGCLNFDDFTYGTGVRVPAFSGISETGPTTEQAARKTVAKDVSTSSADFNENGYELEARAEVSSSTFRLEAMSDQSDEDGQDQEKTGANAYAATKITVEGAPPGTLIPMKLVLSGNFSGASAGVAVVLRVRDFDYRNLGGLTIIDSPRVDGIGGPQRNYTYWPNPYEQDIFVRDFTRASWTSPKSLEFYYPATVNNGIYVELLATAAGVLGSHSAEADFTARLDFEPPPGVTVRLASGKTFTGVSDSDNDGVADVDDDMPNDATLASPVAATGTGKIEIDASATAGTTLSQVRTISASDPLLNRDGIRQAFPDGLVAFKLNGLNPGATATVTLIFPTAFPAGAKYYKIGPNGLYEFPSAQINGNTVTLTIVDGGLGDNDLVANGVIDDPGGVGLANEAPSKPVLVSPTNGQQAIDSTITLEWKPSEDPENDEISYLVYLCDDGDPLNNCSPYIDIAALDKPLDLPAYYAGLGFGLGGGIAMLGFAIAGAGVSRRQKVVILTVIVLGTLLSSCGGGGGDDKTTATNNKTYTVSGLASDTTYNWAVVAKDSNGIESVSEVWSFKTQ